MLKSPSEHIIRIKGTYSLVSGLLVITSLTFISNTTAYGPYGRTDGEEFTSSGLGKVVGFFGRAGSYIDQLGVISTTIETTTSSNAEGSWGGDGGNVFSDGRGDIAEIRINYNSDQIVAFQAIYVHNGTRFPGRIHGGDGGKSETVHDCLNYLNAETSTQKQICLSILLQDRPLKADWKELLLLQLLQECC